MRAARVTAHGGPDAIAIVELPTPSPGPGEALVRVLAAGVNFIDVYTRSGLYKSELPIALGVEGAGIVEALGAGVVDFAVGDRVAWASVRGSYATHVVAHTDKLVKVPESVDAHTAAAGMLQGMTAHFLARATYALAESDTCLVHAAAGGVGLLLCQFAKRAGARVIGTVSTREKAELATRAGADHVILYTEEDFVVEVRRITSGAGVSVVYDSVGKTTFRESLRCLRPRGLLVTFGQSSGPIAPFDPLALKDGSLYVTRPGLNDYTATKGELAMRAGEVLGAIANGELRVRVHAALALDEAARAHRMLEARETAGKVVLTP